MQKAFSLARDRRTLLIVFGGLHIVALMAYSPPKYVREAEMTFLTLVQVPKAEPKKAVPDREPKVFRKAPRTVRELPAPAPAMTVIATPPETSEPAPEMPSLEAGVKERALDRAGDIDKELRDKSFYREDRKKLAYERPKFERDLEAAGKPRGVVVEEIVAPGGRKITRINGKCYYAPHGYNSIMRDPFKSGPPLITQANCPREK